jgi:hypothetical protein
MKYNIIDIQPVHKKDCTTDREETKVDHETEAGQNVTQSQTQNGGTEKDRRDAG